MFGHLTPTHRGASDLGFKTSADLQHPEATERSECQGWRDGVNHFLEWSHISINNPGLPVSFPGPRGLEVAPPLSPLSWRGSSRGSRPWPTISTPKRLWFRSVRARGWGDPKGCKWVELLP